VHAHIIPNHSQVGPGTPEVARRYASFAFLRGSSSVGRPTWKRNLTPSKKPRREPDCGYLRATSTSTPGPRSTAHRRGQRPVDDKSANRTSDLGIVSYVQAWVTRYPEVVVRLGERTLSATITRDQRPRGKSTALHRRIGWNWSTRLLFQRLGNS
jgi:hypothetical protein